MPGRNRLVQDSPRLVEVAQPMFDEPPPKTRPTWNADTIVLPNWNVSGSTSVWCCACASVYGSLLTCVTGTLAYALVAVKNNTTAVAGTARAAPRMDRIRPTLPNRNMGRSPFSGAESTAGWGSAVHARRRGGPRLGPCLPD